MPFPGLNRGSDARHQRGTLVPRFDGGKRCPVAEATTGARDDRDGECHRWELLPSLRDSHADVSFSPRTASEAPKCHCFAVPMRCRGLKRDSIRSRTKREPEQPEPNALVPGLSQRCRRLPPMPLTKRVAREKLRFSCAASRTTHRGIAAQSPHLCHSNQRTCGEGSTT